MKRAATLFEPMGIDLSSVGSSFLSSMSRNLDMLLSPSFSSLLSEEGEEEQQQRKETGTGAGGRKRINRQGVFEEEEQADNIGKTGDQRHVCGAMSACICGWPCVDVCCARPLCPQCT